jgi:hypothetical protein
MQCSLIILIVASIRMKFFLPLSFLVTFPLITQVKVSEMKLAAPTLGANTLIIISYCVLLPLLI